MSNKHLNGAPFGTRKPRFDVAGIHPKRRPPGTITQVSYDQKSMTKLNRKLGPGKYNVDAGSFSSRNIGERSSGPGWRRSFQSSQAAKIPHLLYYEEWERKQTQKEMLGPGTYNIPDSFYELNMKPGSTRGICQTRAQRFICPDKNVPGPGTYCKQGISHMKCTGTVGMAATCGRRHLPEVGSGLCPGQYSCKSFLDELSERVISKRGPYDLFTGDRNKPITFGHLATPNRGPKGPSEYEIKTFLDEWNDKHKKRRGKFSRVARTSDTPSERIYCCTLSQCPRKPHEPGPGSYTQRDTQILTTLTRPSFGSSATRADKTFLMGGSSGVGPGSYNIVDCQPHRNGCHSAFVSNTKRWDSNRDKYLRERIRPKDVPIKDRMFLAPTVA